MAIGLSGSAGNLGLQQEDGVFSRPSSSCPAPRPDLKNMLGNFCEVSRFSASRTALLRTLPPPPTVPVKGAPDGRTAANAATHSRKYTIHETVSSSQFKL